MIFLYLLESFPLFHFRKRKIVQNLTIFQKKILSFTSVCKKESDKGNIVDDYNKIKFFINVLK